MIRTEVAVALSAQLGESPVWDVDRRILHLVDILAQKIHRFDPATGRVESIAVNGPPGALALCTDGSYIAGVGLDLVRITADGVVNGIATVSAGERFNDGKCDARGRFIGGTMDIGGHPAAAALYQLHVDGRVTQLLDKITLSNGLDWNPAGDRLYHIDTVLERVFVCSYDLDSGQIGPRQVFADLTDAPGRPDGLTVDADGGVWVAVARGAAVHHYSSDGRLQRVIPFPTPIVTSCTFGGRDLDRLYVTSSRALLPEGPREQDRLAGAVFVVEGLGVQGRPASRFAG